MSWIFLALAIAFELAGTTSMKLSEGFTKGWPSVGLVVFYIVSFGLMTLALKDIPISIVYAIWSGAGTAAITVIGMIWFKEPMGAQKLAFIVLIIAGVVGLNLTGSPRG